MLFFTPISGNSLIFNELRLKCDHIEVYLMERRVVVKVKKPLTVFYLFMELVGLFKALNSSMMSALSVLESGKHKYKSITAVWLSSHFS